MSNRTRCTCQRCTIRGFMGPAVVITLGILFLLGQLRGDFFSFWRTYPVLLIVMGLIILASAFASTESHVDSDQVAPTSPVPPYPAAPSGSSTPGPLPGQGQ